MAHSGWNTVNLNRHLHFSFVAKRHCGPVVRAFALRSGDPGFKTRLTTR